MNSKVKYCFVKKLLTKCDRYRRERLALRKLISEIEESLAFACEDCRGRYFNGQCKVCDIRRLKEIVQKAKEAEKCK